MLLSGGAGLAWQLIWTQQFALGLGHEIIAVLAVLAAFFAGLALGAWLLRRRIELNPRAWRWYVGLELLIAAGGLTLSLCLPLLPGLTSLLMGAQPHPAWHGALAFALPLLALLPMTAAMGATLLVLERQLRDQPQSALGDLYAANTLGAVLGVLGVVFLALPSLGVQATALLCAALNAGCAALACLIWGTQRHPAPAPKPPQPLSTQLSAKPLAPARMLVLLAATGFLGIGYEVLAVRVLSQVTENTVYSYALLLACYLVGTATGAALYARAARRHTLPPALLQWLLALLVGAVLAGGASLWWADVLVGADLGLTAPRAAALGAETLAAAAAMLVPTVVMGALFTHLCGLARQNGWTLGAALATNTAAAALAPLAIGVGLLPLVGAKGVLLLILVGYLLLMPWAAWRSRWAPVLTVLPALATAALAIWASPLRFVQVPEGGRVLSYRDGVMASVSVVQDAQGTSRLRINNRAQEGSSASGALEMRLALLPMLLHPQPQDVLMLGLGTGFTARTAAMNPALSVRAVELLPEVITASALFAPGRQSDRPRLIAADARRFVLATPELYDVVVADLFHPARSGAGSLYTVEHFDAVRRRLAPGGVFCQWLALHQMELSTLRSVVAAFMQVYPQGVAVLASNSLDTPVIGLIARDGPLPDVPAISARLNKSTQPMQRVYAQARLDDAYAVLGSVLATPAALTQWAGQTRANSDDRPVVIHEAPWATYAPASSPRQRLLDLLDELPPSASGNPRLNAYQDVRKRYLQLGIRIQPSANPQAMLDQLEQPLLALLRESPDFRPAADALSNLAQAAQSQNPLRAQAVLDAVRQAQAAQK